LQQTQLPPVAELLLVAAVVPPAAGEPPVAGCEGGDHEYGAAPSFFLQVWVQPLLPSRHGDWITRPTESILHSG
jgi:hypothetical protein